MSNTIRDLIHTHLGESGFGKTSWYPASHPLYLAIVDAIEHGMAVEREACARVVEGTISSRIRSTDIARIAHRVRARTKEDRRSGSESVRVEDGSGDAEFSEIDLEVDGPQIVLSVFARRNTGDEDRDFDCRVSLVLSHAELRALKLRVDHVLNEADEKFEPNTRIGGEGESKP